MWKWHARCATWGTATTRKKNLPGCVGHPGMFRWGSVEIFSWQIQWHISQRPEYWIPGNDYLILFDACSDGSEPISVCSRELSLTFHMGIIMRKTSYILCLLLPVMRCFFNAWLNAWIGGPQSLVTYIFSRFQVGEILILNPPKGRLDGCTPFHVRVLPWYENCVQPWDSWWL